MLESGELEMRGQSRALRRSKWKESSLWWLYALMVPSESTRSDSCLWHRAYGPPACLHPTSRNSQHEILEDCAELFSLFGWRGYKRRYGTLSLLFLARRDEYQSAVRLTEGTENT